MKPEDFMDEAFLKKFKDGKEFMSFMEQMYKRGVEKMLEGELDAHFVPLLVLSPTSIVNHHHNALGNRNCFHLKGRI
jgi:hypothetical protein